MFQFKFQVNLPHTYAMEIGSTSFWVAYGRHSVDLNITIQTYNADATVYCKKIFWIGVLHQSDKLAASDQVNLKWNGVGSVLLFEETGAGRS